MDDPYPFESGPAFVRDAWYVAAWSAEVTRTPIQRTLLGDSIALFRAESGKLVALADRCPHRGYPLSQSTVVGDAIRCNYHGFTYDASGTCISIPSQTRLPDGFRTRHYPVAERWKWIWVWAGSPEEADESLIPDHAHAGLEGDEWLAEIGGDFHCAARYQLFNENLLDLTHLTFLHPGTIGTPGILESESTIEVDGRAVIVKRDTLDEFATPFYAKRLGIAAQRIDRSHVTTFIAPSFHIIGVTTREAASAVAGGAPMVFGQHKIVHAIRPETETTMHDYWAFTRTYNKAPDITEYLRRTIGEVIQQDIVALEAVENLLPARTSADFSCAADGPALKGRRVVQALLTGAGKGN